MIINNYFSFFSTAGTQNEQWEHRVAAKLGAMRTPATPARFNPIEKPEEKKERPPTSISEQLKANGIENYFTSALTKPYGKP